MQAPAPVQRDVLLETVVPEGTLPRPSLAVGIPGTPGLRPDKTPPGHTSAAAGSLTAENAGAGDTGSSGSITALRGSLSSKLREFGTPPAAGGISSALAASKAAAAAAAAAAGGAKTLPMSASFVTNGTANNGAGDAIRTPRKRVEWQLEEPSGAPQAVGGRAIPTPGTGFHHGPDSSADTPPPPALSSSLSRSFGAGLPSWLQDLEQRQLQQPPGSPRVGGLPGATEALLAARPRSHAPAAAPTAQPAVTPASLTGVLHQPPAALRPQDGPAPSPPGWPAQQPSLRPLPQAPQPPAPASQQRVSAFPLPPHPAPQPAGLLSAGAALGLAGALPPPPAPHQIAPPGYLLVPHPHPHQGHQPPAQPPPALLAQAQAPPPPQAQRAGLPMPQHASARTDSHGGPAYGLAAPHLRMSHHGHSHHHHTASQHRHQQQQYLEPRSSGYVTDAEAGGVNGDGGGSEVESASGGRGAAATLMRVGSAPARGRSGLPRVSSISEIEPHVEEEAPRLSSSMLTRAIMIPGGSDRPRTYRVAPAKSQGSQDSVTVVLEGAEEQEAAGGAYGGVGGSVRGGRGFLSGLGIGHAGSNYPSYGSSLPGSGGAAAVVLGAGAAANVPAPSSSFLGGSLLGGLFGGRGGGGGGSAAGGAAGAPVTPDGSVHGPDSYYGVPEPAFGSLPTSSALLRARGLNASAGSILTKATGGLKTQMKKSTSSGNFGSLWPQPPPPPPPAAAAQRNAGGGAAGVPLGAGPGAGLSGAAGGGHAPRSSVTGGSGGSSAGTSAGGSGLGFWMRRSTTLPHRTSGPGADSAASGTDGSTHGGNASRRGAVPVSVSRQNTEPDLADLAMLATSLPASLGTWSMPRSMALATSPAHAAAGFAARPLSRANSTVSATSAGAGSMFGAGSGSLSMGHGGGGGGLGLGGGGSGAGPSTMGPPTYPICLICLEVLTPEEFESGEAISLQCLCKGEVSLRHRRCAIEWSHHKGDVVCDICKQPIANLPPIPDEVLAAREAARRRRQPAFNTAAEPNLADHIFDCIRATWVAMIICVLFFDMTVGQAFMVGAIIGVAFATVTMTIAACARRARARAAARAVERATEESRAAERRQQQQQQQHRGGTGDSGAAGEPSLTTPLLSENV